MSGHPQEGQYDDGYGHHPPATDSYYQDDGQGYYDQHPDYQHQGGQEYQHQQHQQQPQQQHHGSGGYYDEA